MFRNVVLGIGLSAVLVVGVSAAEDPDRGAGGDPDKGKAAVAAARHWLSLVDAGHYKESWRKAGAYFKESVRPAAWALAGSAVRGPLGEVVSRKVKSTTPRTSLPDAPDGEYVVVVIETTFRNKTVTETLTLRKWEDDVWLVCVYQVR